MNILAPTRIRRSSSRDSLPSLPRNLFFTPSNPITSPPAIQTPELIESTAPPPGYYDIPLPRAHSFPSLPNLSFTPSSPPSWQPPLLTPSLVSQSNYLSNQSEYPRDIITGEFQYPSRPDYNHNSRRASASSSQSSSSRLNGFTSSSTTTAVGQEFEGEEEDNLEIRSRSGRRRRSTTTADLSVEGISGNILVQRRKVTDPNMLPRARRLSGEEEADPVS